MSCPRRANRALGTAPWPVRTLLGGENSPAAFLLAVGCTADHNANPRYPTRLIQLTSGGVRSTGALGQRLAVGEFVGDAEHDLQRVLAPSGLGVLCPAARLPDLAQGPL